MRYKCAVDQAAITWKRAVAVQCAALPSPMDSCLRQSKPLPVAGPRSLDSGEFVNRGDRNRSAKQLLSYRGKLLVRYPAEEPLASV